MQGIKQRGGGGGGGGGTPFQYLMNSHDAHVRSESHPHITDILRYTKVHVAVSWNNGLHNDRFSCCKMRSVGNLLKNYPAQSCGISSDFSQLGLRPCQHNPRDFAD